MQQEITFFEDNGIVEWILLKELEKTVEDCPGSAGSKENCTEIFCLTKEAYLNYNHIHID